MPSKWYRQKPFAPRLAVLTLDIDILLWPFCLSLHQDDLSILTYICALAQVIVCSKESPVVVVLDWPWDPRHGTKQRKGQGRTGVSASSRH